ncbi:hypothetical protein COO60DRAFT_560958 [Scenedesmus sp. NREL 46B-D3]|nr:hypothetical protein COO60DRAFT_560958 [Scenedesmus sp. NREL 46B-D3]
MAEQSEGLLYVALHEHNEAVALRQHDLPRDPEDVLNLLSSEAAPLQCWFDTAKSYLSQDQAAAFVNIVQEAQNEETLQGIRNYFHREPLFERVQLLCALAAYYTEAARAERDLQERARLGQQAEQFIRQAEGLRSSEMLPSMTRGFMAMARNEPHAAMLEYKRAEKLRHNGNINHAPLLAQAALHYTNGDLSQSIQLYAQVLRANPACPPEVRLGIAACYYRAGKLEAATAAYNRVLQLDASSADALLGLAVIKFGSSNVQEGLNAGLQLLQRAFQADPTHPGVLCALSHFCLLKGQGQQALQLAQAALEGSDTDRLRGVALGLLGRCHHALGDLAAAQHHYAQAIRLDPKAPLPHLGTAQVYLATGGDPTNSVSELELVLNALPGNPDALWLLGGLLPVQPARVAKTLQAHREAAQRQVDNASLQQMLGELLAATEPAAALEAFSRALALHSKKKKEVLERNEARASKRAALDAAGDDALAAQLEGSIEQDEPVPVVPAKLLNNTAVLKYRAGAVGEAMALLNEAEASIKADPSKATALQTISMGYNMARLQEATGELKNAQQMYRSLVQQFPGYIDCYLRLSAMAKAAGDMAEAQHWAAQATQQAGGHVDAQAMLATLHMERGDLNAARECVGRVEGSSDPYMQLTHANVVMAALPADRSARNPADKARRDYIYKALHMYREVLKQQPDNIYAVNGLGTCLAELGHTTAAKQAFDEVMRASAKTKGFVRLPEMYVNLGNLWLARQQYNDALIMYEHASKLHNHKNAQVLLYMARAQHDSGDHLAAKRALLKALHLAPSDIKIRFNLAFVLQEWAVKVFKRKYISGDPAKLKDYSDAESALMEAEKIFNQLHALGKDATRIEPKKVALHAQYCHQQLPSAANLVRQAHAEQAVVQSQQKVRQAELAAAEAQRKLKEDTASAARKAAETRKMQQAHRALEDSRQTLEQMKSNRQMAAMADTNEGEGGGKGGSKRKRGGGGKKGAAGDDMGDFYVDDAQPIERLPKAHKDDADVQVRRQHLGAAVVRQAVAPLHRAMPPAWAARQPAQPSRRSLQSLIACSRLTRFLDQTRLILTEVLPLVQLQV